MTSVVPSSRELRISLAMIKSPRFVILSHVFDGVCYQSFQHFLVNVRQALYIQTGFAGLVLAEFLHKRLEAAEAGQYVHNERLFTGRVASDHEVAFAATGVFVMVSAISDDARPPHRGAFAGCPAHHRRDFSNVRTLLRVVDRVNELADARLCRLRLVLGHANFRQRSEVPNKRSPASPRPGTMYLFSL